MEKLHYGSTRERTKGGRSIWEEWHFGPLLEFLRDGTQDYHDYYGIEFETPELLHGWLEWQDRDDYEGAMEYWESVTNIFKEFSSWEEAEMWFEKCGG